MNKYNWLEDENWFNNIDLIVDYLLEQNKGDYRNCIANLIGSIQNKNETINKIKDVLG